MTGMLILICVLLLLAYLFDITFAKTKIPTVILLLALGWGVKQIVNYFKIHIPYDLDLMLPFFGNIGLLLIVLEGAMELKLDRSKAKVITNSFFLAIIPITVFVFGGAWILFQFFQISYLFGLMNLIPLGIISSAISIPSSENLNPRSKEYIIYEGSFSDIIGILFFNLVIMNTMSDVDIMRRVTLMFVGIFIISFVSILLLGYMLQHIHHKVKYMPIILLALLMYSVAEYYHMPALIFIMLFGLFLANAEKISHLKIMEAFHTEKMPTEVNKFKELVAEMAFLVRSVFFLLFGYLLDTSELLNTRTLLWAILIVAVIYLIRFIHLRIFKIYVFPLLFMAPRGLITIVLFLSIPVADKIPFVSKSLIIQVILLTAICMMIQLLVFKKKKPISDSQI